MLAWIDLYCHYRERRVILRHFEVLSTPRFVEDDYIVARLAASHLRALGWLMDIGPSRAVIRWIYQKLGGVVILAERPAQPS